MVSPELRVSDARTDHEQVMLLPIEIALNIVHVTIPVEEAAKSVK